MPLGLSLRVLPLDRFAPVQPYLTIGGDVLFYKYEEFGDFIASEIKKWTIVVDAAHLRQK